MYHWYLPSWAEINHISKWNLGWRLGIMESVNRRDRLVHHPLYVLPDRPALITLTFLSTNELLTLRLCDSIARDFLYHSPVWNLVLQRRRVTAGSPKEWYFSRVPTAFERFLLQTRYHSRWTRNEKHSVGTKITLDVEVFARIKNGLSTSPRHILCDPSFQRLMIMQSSAEHFDFSFAKVFPQQSSQRNVFETLMGRFLFDASLGLSSTVFFYGQTGSGKTHTCLGSDSALDGVVPETLREVLSWNVHRVHFRVLEIYCEKVETLVVDTSIRDFERDAVPLLRKSMEGRVIRATSYNARSSRSHAIFSIKVQFLQGVHRLDATINLVDLAGAERQREDAPLSSPLATEDIIAAHRRALVKEASKINQSLTTLGRVIRALSESTGASSQQQHIPYRDSRLTLLLRSSLGGSVNENDASGRTAFVLTLSDDESNIKETLATLRFGHAAQQVRLERTKTSSPPYGWQMMVEYSRKLRKANAEIAQLESVWHSCGEGRHDILCRCDRCLMRAERIEPDLDLPFHIPKYVALREKKQMYEQLLDEGRLALMGAFAN